MAIALLMMTTACAPALEQFPPRPVTNMPLAIASCDLDLCSKNVVGLFTFNGPDGTGEWPIGVRSQLHVDRFDSEGVIIQRADTQDSRFPGLVATYRGTLQGNQITGKVNWTFKGKNNSGKWSATIPPTLAQQQDLINRTRAQEQQQAQAAASGGGMGGGADMLSVLLMMGMAASAMGGGDGGGGGGGVSVEEDRMQQYYGQQRVNQSEADRIERGN